MAVLIGDVNNSGGTNDSYSAGQAALTKYVAAATGDIDTVRFRQRASGYTSVTIAIYADAGGDPDGAPTGNPLGTSSTCTDNTAGEKIVTFSPAVHVTAGTTYNFGWLPIGGFLDYTTTVAAGHYHSKLSQTSWPAPWGTSDTDAAGGIPVQGESSGGGGPGGVFIPRRTAFGG